MNKYALGNEISNLEEAKKRIDDAIKWKHEELRRMQKWWLSDDVWELKNIQDYIKDFSGNCLGYIWSDRKKSDDKFLESNWKWTKKELAKFCTSKIWRYYSEEKVKTKELLKRYYLDWKNSNL
jgi:hypothetical protein